MFLIYKFRIFLLACLIFFNLLFIISLPFGRVPHTMEYWVMGTIINFLLSLFAAFLLHMDSSNKSNIDKLEFITNTSVYSYAFYDYNQSELFISFPAMKLFNISTKPTYALDELEQYFGEQDWNEIKHLIDQPFNNSSEKTGVLHLKTKGKNTRYIRYHAKTIFDKQLSINGIIIWFMDASETIAIEEEIVELVKKYRLISFENDLILNSLPFPVWRRDIAGNITFNNHIYLETIQDPTSKKGDNDLNQSLRQLAAKSLHANRTQKSIHSIKLKNKFHTFEFFEMPLGESLGTIGYAVNIEGHKEIGQQLKTLKEAFNALIEISSRAHIMLNYKQEIISFNKNILELYNIDYQWMKSHPTFSSFIDMLYEIHKLPEVQDYKAYKGKLLKRMRELTYHHSELMHLPNNTTLGYYFIPLKDGSMIISIDDISESLNLERTLNEQIIVQSQILNYLQNPIIILGQDARLKSFNEAMVKNFNLKINFVSSTPRIEKLLEIMLMDNKEMIEKLTIALANALEKREENNILDPVNNQLWEIRNLPDSSIIILINHL